MVCARATVVLAIRPIGSDAQARRTMRKQTAPRTRKRRHASSRKQRGLIAQDVSAPQSAMEDSVLDNHSHRTTIRLLVSQHNTTDHAHLLEICCEHLPA